MTAFETGAFRPSTIKTSPWTPRILRFFPATIFLPRAVAIHINKGISVYKYRQSFIYGDLHKIKIAICGTVLFLPFIHPYIELEKFQPLFDERIRHEV